MGYGECFFNLGVAGGTAPTVLAIRARSIIRSFCIPAVGQVLNAPVFGIGDPSRYGYRSYLIDEVQCQ